MTEYHTQHYSSGTTQVSDHLRSPEFHLDVLTELVYEAECDGAVPLASFPDNRYPYTYPRDVACITRAWITALRASIRPELCREHIVDAARFYVAVQSDNGVWQQRYSLDGEDKGIYIQEDNTGHGLRILAHALQALTATNSLDDVDETFQSNVVDAIERAVSYVHNELYDPNAHLIESTTSIHEGRIESGYTLWVNCTYVAALRDAQAALDTVPEKTVDIERTIDEFRTLLERSIKRAFTAPQQMPRRYSRTGEIDIRPDVTLLAPYYYELDDLFGDSLEAAAERATTALEDPHLGGLQRFFGFSDDYEVQQHGGNGPWMQYTAWHAQYRFDQGEVEAGDGILATIAQYVGNDGYIPEHLTTRSRYEAFMQNEWHTRQDFEKEFDEAVLRDVPFDMIVEEVGHMRDSYRNLASQLNEREVVRFALPLAWSHAEFLTALVRRSNAV
jgi:GH15 family glucan-1,4-alpha-glucosidase